MLTSTILRRLALGVRLIRKRLVILNETRIRGGNRRRAVDRMRRIHRIKKEKESYAEEIFLSWHQGETKPTPTEINEVMFYGDNLTWEILKSYRKKYSSDNI